MRQARRLRARAGRICLIRFTCPLAVTLKPGSMTFFHDAGHESSVRYSGVLRPPKRFMVLRMSPTASSTPLTWREYGWMATASKCFAARALYSAHTDAHE